MEYESLKAKYQTIKDLLKKEKDLEAPPDPSRNSGEGAPDGKGEPGSSGGAQSAQLQPTSSILAGSYCTTDLTNERKEATRRVNAYLSLMVEPPSQVEIKQGILNSPVGKVMGIDNKSYPVVVTLEVDVHTIV